MHGENVIMLRKQALDHMYAFDQSWQHRVNVQMSK